jgi:hypothetical protein
MRIVLNCIPLLLAMAIGYCVYAYSGSAVEMTTLIPLFTALVPAFVASLAWRATPAGTEKKISLGLFMFTLVFGAILIEEPASARNIWMYPAACVLLSVHLYLFAISKSSYLFSGGRIALLYVPFVMSAFGLIGMWLWNGTLTISSVGLIIAVIFALLTLLFGYKKGFEPPATPDAE